MPFWGNDMNLSTTLKTLKRPGDIAQGSQDHGTI